MSTMLRNSDKTGLHLDPHPPRADWANRRTRVSQHDVALAAGVSQSSVSRAFSADSEVKPEIRRAVLTAAEELGYRPNAIAQSLVQGSTHMVGLVVTPFFNPYYTHVVRVFTTALQEHGYWTMLLNVPDRLSAEETLPLALRYQLDGIIFASATLSSGLVSECARSGTPVVLFNRYVLGQELNSVFCDNIEGGRIVADALLSGGHRRFAYVAGDEDTSTNMDRETGFARRLEQCGYRLHLREAGDDTYESGCQAAARLLSREDRPDAIFCATDLMAAGVLDTARREFGVSVPDDLSVIGFDDIPMASWSSYSLTTVRQPVRKMVAATIRILTDPDLTIHGTTAIMQRIPPSLVVRSSARISPNSE